MLATCRKLFEFICHGSYMRIIPQHVSGHVRDTCMKFLGISKCKFYMLVTCRKCFRNNHVSFSSTMIIRARYYAATSSKGQGPQLATHVRKRSATGVARSAGWCVCSQRCAVHCLQLANQNLMAKHGFKRDVCKLLAEKEGSRVCPDPHLFVLWGARNQGKPLPKTK